MAPTLHALADGAEHPISQLRGTIAQQVGLTDEDLKSTLPSGSRLLVNRLHWTITYLYQAGLVRRPRRAVVQITKNRRVEKLAASLGVTGLYKSQVSVMAGELDEVADSFRNGRWTAGRTRSAGSTR